MQPPAVTCNLVDSLACHSQPTIHSAARLARCSTHASRQARASSLNCIPCCLASLDQALALLTLLLGSGSCSCGSGGCGICGC
jgi:hypothetical protein